ncbi:MAG: tRNA pseudouridine(55) synthase TruB [Proteobacteria bacterium]|nr:tRNA pseudouridine(55) synthase TruB [Pseudomonadota bacterium]MCH8221494.1 tRNA pseudouridine(55) synthase TruB [Pseudomonadota bacterium]
MSRARGGRQKGRVIDGVLLLDKPIGLTSNQALQRVKRLFDARKAGHTGSLDPLASGLLPICLGQATKVSGFLLNAGKRYQVVARLGQRTDTGDADGQVIEERPVPALDRGLVKRVLARFEGSQTQVPPMYSALKHQGQRLYKLARQGIEIERQPREIEIHGLELLSLEADALELEVACSKGTYVRTLVEDIARALGTVAHVIVLRRLGVGPYAEGRMYKLEELEALAEQGMERLDELLLPVDSALKHWPSVELGADSAYYLMQGQAVMAPGAPSSGKVRLYDEGHGFLGIGEVKLDGRVAPTRLFPR